jgi:dipeptidase E
MNRGVRILLISNSTVYGGDYLDHVESEIKSFVGPNKSVLFFPFALFDREVYAAKARARFAKMGLACESVHQVNDPKRAIEGTDAIFVGGGNTFRLLKALQDSDLIEPIRRRVRGGTRYIGSSAGSNVAGPTIKTTKDMPIVQPRSFDSLGLVPFQIPMQTRSIWAKRRRNGLSSSSKKRRRQSSACGKGPGYSARTVPSP